MNTNTPSPTQIAADLARVEAYLQGVTPGPWHYQSCGEKCYSFVMGGYAPMDEKDTLPPPGPIQVEEYDEDKDEYRERYFLNEFVASSEEQSGHVDFNFCCQARTDLPLLVAHCRALLRENAELRAALGDRGRQAGQGDVPKVEVAIIGPEGIVHYRRPWGHPDIEEALRTRGYSIQAFAPAVAPGASSNSQPQQET